MKIKTLVSLIALLALLSILNFQLSASPLGTAFTYQGRLVDGGNPAQGSYDFQFSIFDSDSSGNVVAGPLTNSAVAVTNGLFTTSLDFGEGVFAGDARWLEIGVRTNGAAADFTPLSPRQSLTPAPYALYAPGAGVARTASSVSGPVAASQLTGAISSNNIGTGAITTSMLASGAVGSAQMASGAITAAALDPAIGVWTKSGSNIGYVGGNVGIGTAAPQATLDVNGIGRMAGFELANPWAGVPFNATWDSGLFTWRRLGEGYAGLLQQSGSDGGLNWAVADTGSAGEAVSWRYPLRLTKEGDVVIDSAGANTNGALSGGLRFGWSGSGEGLASKRSEGGNEWGLDFYTASQPRVSIANNGNVGIGTNNPQSALHVAGAVTADNFLGSGTGLTGISGAALADGSVTSSKIAAGSVGSTQLASNAVTSDNIAPGQVVRQINGLTESVILAAGPNVTITPSGNALQIAAVAGINGVAGWGLTGNSNTLPGVNFLGTTDYQPLEFKVNNQRALRLEPSANGAPNVIEGSAINFVSAGTEGATISGGGNPNDRGHAMSNSVSASFGTIGGGEGNSIENKASFSTIGGGVNNIIRGNAWFSTIAGGVDNTIHTNAWKSTIGGGDGNTIQMSAWGATIGGGANNTIQSNATQCVIAGGDSNTIKTNADHSLIGGGYNNSVEGSSYATIPGGYVNRISMNASYATIAGGQKNSIWDNAEHSVIGGGSNNTAAGRCATVPGGRNNFAAGTNSFAAGYRAKAIGPGSFVWGDTTEADVVAAAANQFVVRASGGVRFNTAGNGAMLDNQPLLTSSSTISSSQLADNAVTAAKIQDGAIADADISSSGISGSKIVGGDLQAYRLKVGLNHKLIGPWATIAGGYGNTAWSLYDTVGGGETNEASGGYSTVGGGGENMAHAGYSTVGGGGQNQALGWHSTVPGGYQNTASGAYSFAAGVEAYAQHAGTFVWADTSGGTFSSSTSNQFLVRAKGGVLFKASSVKIVSPISGVTLVELGEGLDYAEGFDVSSPSKPAPGTVMVIDAQQRGKLAVSRKAYERGVAGIVAGANGLGSAVRLATGRFDCDVALAGRVYCNADASFGAVLPGDLLTTSPTPGYAMVVKDHAKAQGAILGKAMEPLAKGEKRQILVLVTLQ